ncbi:MAG: Gfo/Idh/MocA family oxidoreductase, partial [Candidatus Omnitrophota bacterium]
MNILVVGFGKMGMLHAATLKALRPRSQLIICDPSGIIGAGLSRFLPQAKFYNDLDRALESQKTDLAVVAAPNGAHFGIFQKLITHNIHMLVEKPFVTDFQEARLVHQRLMPAAEARRPIPKVMVGYCLRFVQTFEMAKD